MLIKTKILADDSSIKGKSILCDYIRDHTLNRITLADVESLVLSGLNLDQLNDKSLGGLVHIYLTNDECMVPFIAQADFSFNTQDKYGYTALIKAALKINKQTTQIYKKSIINLPLNNELKNFIARYKDRYTYDITNRSLVITGGAASEKEKIELLDIYEDKKIQSAITDVLSRFYLSDLLQQFPEIKSHLYYFFKKSDLQKNFLELRTNLKILTYIKHVIKNPYRQIDLYSFFISKFMKYYNFQILLKKAVEKKVNFDLTTNNKETLLHVAAGTGDLDVVKAVCETGINLDARDHAGDTALKLAIKHTCIPERKNDFMAIARYLIEKNADVSIPNNDGWTDLMLAIENEAPSLIDLLLSKKAPIHPHSKNGFSATSLAYNLEDKETLNKIKSRINEILDDLRVRIGALKDKINIFTGREAENIVNTLYDLNMLDIDASQVFQNFIHELKQQTTDKKRFEALHSFNICLKSLRTKDQHTATYNLAKNLYLLGFIFNPIEFKAGHLIKELFLGITSEELDLVFECIMQKADINARDEDGCTALQVARNIKNKNIIKLLIAVGAKE